jgi:hypothetical protein
MRGSSDLSIQGSFILLTERHRSALLDVDAPRPHAVAQRLSHGVALKEPGKLHKAPSAL